jgi:GT2 family glycosyltransferase
METVVSPLTFRFLTKKVIGLNSKLGTPPYQPLSIVVPSYNDFKYLRVLLKSLDRTLSEFEYEVIISDDFCDERNSLQLKTLESEKVKVVFSQERTGFAGAVNRGIKEAQWDVILLNSDIKALPYWAENLQAAAYNIDPHIGLVSPHLLYPSGRIQYGGTFHAATIAPQWFAHLDQGRLANDSRASVGKYVKAISGACVYIKREVLDKQGCLDSQYWLGFEDVDFAFNASAHGFRSYVEPSSKLVHLESASRGKIQGFKEYESMRRFWDKWTLNSSEFNSKTEIAFFLSTTSSPLLNAVATSIVHELFLFSSWTFQILHYLV